MNAKELYKLILETQESLHSIMDRSKNLNEPGIVKKSQELDKLLNQYKKLRDQEKEQSMVKENK